MGTSKRYSGSSPSNPLLPSWLEVPPQVDPIPEPVPPVDDPGELLPVEPVIDPAETVENPDEAEPDGNEDSHSRFMSARRAIGSVARGTKGTDGLGRAVAEYVRSGLGGSRTAAARMVNSSRSAGRILGFIQSVQEKGFHQTAREFGLGDCAGRSVREIGNKLTELVVQPSGGIDQSISNKAWTDALIEAIQSGIDDFVTLTAEQWLTILQSFISKTIELRLLKDIGQLLLEQTATNQQIRNIRAQLRGLLRGEVRRAMAPLNLVAQRMNDIQIRTITHRIYMQAFAFIQELQQGE